MIDLAAVSDRMLELEDQRDDPRDSVPVGEVVAKLLGVEHSHALDEALVREAQRSVELVRSHYSRYVRPSADAIAAIALVQGITLARAVAEVKDE